MYIHRHMYLVDTAFSFVKMHTNILTFFLSITSISAVDTAHELLRASTTTLDFTLHSVEGAHPPLRFPRIYNITNGYLWSSISPKCSVWTTIA
jgi:hypothetical protein